MVPYKHYAASEIEEVLEKAERTEEEPVCGLPETHAEESTMQRWKKDFSEQMPQLAGQLEQIAVDLGMGETSLIRLSEKPLQRLRAAVNVLQELPSKISSLVYALWLLIFHPVCIQCPSSSL
jgi:hypothetical protein